MGKNNKLGIPLYLYIYTDSCMDAAAVCVLNTRHNLIVFVRFIWVDDESCELSGGVSPHNVYGINVRNGI